MEKNLNTADRIVRTIAALVIAFFLLNGTITGTVGIALAVVAIVLFGTGAISFCPIYAMLGISTRKKAKQSKAAA